MAMAVNRQNHNNPMIRKMESIFRLSEDERAALGAVPMQVQIIRENQDLVREGDRPSRCCALLEGYGCTYKLTGDGKRQIMGFYIPGDIPDLQSLHLRALDTSIGTLTACRVGFIPHEILRDLCRSHPRIADALWRETLVDASIFREWMTSIGRREALNRIAHLFCEWVVRLKAIDLVREDACTFPMTQNEMGDALGISTVHVNRILQDLRGAGLISLKGSTLTVLDWAQLQRVGDFNAGYLHLEPEQAAA
jgi:CRP-like cAMP-binding protein